MTNLFNTIHIDDKENITANFHLPNGRIGTDFQHPNPESFKAFVQPMREACTAFINTVPLQV